MAADGASLLFGDVDTAWTREYPDTALNSFLIGAVLMRMGRMVEKDASDLCTSHFGIIFPEMMLLLALRRSGPSYAARPAHLKRALLLTSGAVTKQIDRLSARGLVERLQDPNSINGQLVKLTDTGFALADEAFTLLASQSVAVRALEALPQFIRDQGWEFCRSMIRELETGANQGARAAKQPRKADIASQEAN